MFNVCRSVLGEGFHEKRWEKEHRVHGHTSVKHLSQRQESRPAKTLTYRLFGGSRSSSSSKDRSIRGRAPGALNFYSCEGSTLRFFLSLESVAMRLHGSSLGEHCSEKARLKIKAIEAFSIFLQPTENMSLALLHDIHHLSLFIFFSFH